MSDSREEGPHHVCRLHFCEAAHRRQGWPRAFLEDDVQVGAVVQHLMQPDNVRVRQHDPPSVDATRRSTLLRKRAQHVFCTSPYIDRQLSSFAISLGRAHPLPREFVVVCKTTRLHLTFSQPERLERIRLAKRTPGKEARTGQDHCDCSPVPERVAHHHWKARTTERRHPLSRSGGFGATPARRQSGKATADRSRSGTSMFL
jgi:hypothetical protein